MNVAPDTNRRAADVNFSANKKRTLENVVSEETFDVSEHKNLRTRMKHFCLVINLTCPNMKSY